MLSEELMASSIRFCCRWKQEEGESLYTTTVETNLPSDWFVSYYTLLKDTRQRSCSSQTSIPFVYALKITDSSGLDCCNCFSILNGKCGSFEECKLFNKQL